ncbi:MAG: hypothetical protein IT429_07405 [Gemmataceae bacterium]|nr:hypothetical protein [Gemmataceae bacterium]
MRYWVYGVDAVSRAPRDPLFFEAASEADARAQAQALGMAVAEVEAVQPKVTPPPAPPAPPRLLGQLIGSIVGCLLLPGTLALVVDWRPGAGWFVPAVLLGWALGGAVGGVVQLWWQGRAAAVGAFLAQHQFDLIAMALLVLAAWLSQIFGGDEAGWVGLLGGVCLLSWWLVRQFRRKGQQQPSSA